MEVKKIRDKFETLKELVQEKTNAPTRSDEKKKSVKDQKQHHLIKTGQNALSDFMYSVAEPITFIESYEIWNDMCSTNNCAFPLIEDVFPEILRSSFLKAVGDNDDTGLLSDSDGDFDNDCENNCNENKVASDVNKIIKEEEISSLSDEEFMRFAHYLARDIKNTYSIRVLEDQSEFKFIICSISFLWVVVASIALAGNYYPENSKIGTFTGDTLPLILLESFVLFGAELLWECFLSWMVLRFNIKINYTRKLGNLLKVPKYFIADLFPAFTSTALSMTTALTINQTIFCLMYYRKSRERVPFFAYVFLSQDRREDRPDTLIFQVTEDIMRFAIYFPFKLLVADLIQSKAIIFIPIAVNNIGDGLAEPVGVAFGKHKYSTTALYHKGKFFHSKFTRSYEGSSCVFITTAAVVAANINSFNNIQFWVTLSVLPFLMTIAEAKAPHTNDGPFLALVGCGFLSIILLI